MPSIRDFSGGVLNQELQNRDNGNGVLFDCKNVLSSWNGELRKRTGTQFLKELEGNSKIIPFRLSDGNDMIMLLRNKEIKCFKFDTDGNFVPFTVSNNTSTSFPTTGWVSNTNGDWTVEGNSSLTNDAYKAITNVYTYNDVDFTSGLKLYYLFENENPVVFSKCSFKWETLGSKAGYIKRFGVDPIVQYSDNGTDWSSAKTYSTSPSYSSWWYEISRYEKLYETACSFTVANQGESTAHKYWRVIFDRKIVEGNFSSVSIYNSIRLSASDFEFFSSSTETELVFSNCPYEDADFDNIKWSQNNQTLTMTCKGKSPYQIKRTVGGFSDSLFTPSDYTTLWTVVGYPACVTYYQNRLWFGGFELYPTRVYSSQFNQDAIQETGFDKFSIPDTILSTSPIQADGTEISGIIENMWGGNNALYCLSEDGVSMIDAQGAIVATNQVEFKLRNREPVNAMVPTVKDDIMIYLGRDKRKIFITDFDFVVQRFKAHCISDNYNDFLQSGIRELHYIPRKSSLIYGVLENGNWFTLLFDIDKGKNALYPFESIGKIIDVQPIKYGSETKLIILTQLPSYQYVLEEKFPQVDQKIMDFMSTQEQQEYTKEMLDNKQAYLDHSVARKPEGLATEIGNLPYLEGEKVEVIADGQYLGERTVQSQASSELFLWEDSINGRKIYTNEENPDVGSSLYDSNYCNRTESRITSVTEALGVVTAIQVYQPIDVTLLGYKHVEDDNVSIVYMASGVPLLVFDAEGTNIGTATSYSDSSLVYEGVTYTRDIDSDRPASIYTTVNYSKTATSFLINSTYIELEEGASNVVMGYKYDSYAALKFLSPYTERKFPKEIAVNFINTGYLEVGNTFDSLKSVLNNLVESVSINGKKVLMNGNYAKTLDKHSFETPYVIVRSDKGLPFIITGMDYRVDMSNYQGGV